jgi:hypothetical protein
MNVGVRPPAVAGLFYPASPQVLGATVDALLAGARAVVQPPPKAIVAPHAGYVYSGPTAAVAYNTVAPRAPAVRRVVVIAPAHRVRIRGVAGAGATHLRTPLGDVPVDTDALREARIPDDVGAHAREHAVEVHLPFVQRLFPHAKVIPLVVGDASPEAVGRTLEALWGGDETLVVVSSDLSHYLPYAEGRALDQETARSITALEPVAPEQACGAVAINGLLWLARRRGMRVECLELRSSGDTAGSRDEVVGYGAFAVYEGRGS